MLSLLLGLSFGGCMTVKPVTDQNITQNLTNPASVLLIDSFLLSSQHGNIYVNSQGHVFMTSDKETGQMKQIATITSDGKMTSTDGRVVASIDESGVIADINNQPVNATISDTGILQMGDTTLSINADGTIEGANQDAPVMNAVGIDVNQHKTVLFLLVGVLGPQTTSGKPMGPTSEEQTFSGADNSDNAPVALGSLDKSLIDEVVKQNISNEASKYIWKS